MPLKTTHGLTRFAITLMKVKPISKAINWLGEIYFSNFRDLGNTTVVVKTVFLQLILNQRKGVTTAQAHLKKLPFQSKAGKIPYFL